MNYQILFCDLDGTLLRSDKALAPATRAALERAARQGVEFVPATGRFFSGIPASVRELPFWRYAVLMNGALVYDRLEDRALRRAELAPETAVRVMERLQDFRGTLDCYMEDSQGWMEARYLQELEHWILDPPAREIVRASRRPMEDLPGYIRRRGRPVQKIQSYFRDPPAGGAEHPAGGVPGDHRGLLPARQRGDHPPGRHQGGGPGVSVRASGHTGRLCRGLRG